MARDLSAKGILESMGFHLLGIRKNEFTYINYAGGVCIRFHKKKGLFAHMLDHYNSSYTIPSGIRDAIFKQIDELGWKNG